MPRKSKVTTETNTKKVSPNKEKKVLEFNVTDMLNWTDEECAERDKDIHFGVAEVRDIFRASANLSEQLASVRSNLNLLKSALAKGLMTGYRVTCPHCKREYIVNSMELNRETSVMCKVCGVEYKENENIKGIALLSDESINDKIKDNETVTI